MNIVFTFNRTTLSTAVENTLAVGKKIIVGFTLIAMVTTQAGAESFVKKTMEDFLKTTTMSNITNPKAFETATRGVVSGGSIAVRNKIFNNQLISFVPPSFTASCNGIDMFLGSFSFINADEIVQMFRSIAANALGFLFQLALATVSALIGDLIQKFADVVREINNLVSDSCNMAQGIVNFGLDTMSGFNRKQTSNASLYNAVKGLGDSFETTWNKITDTKSPTEAQSTYRKDEAYENGEFGNLMWSAMHRNSLNGVNRPITSRLRNLGLSDVEETIMSLTGFLIAKPTKKVGGDAQDEYSKHGGKLSLKALIEGSQTQEYIIYKCDNTDRCENPEPKPQQDAKGMAQLLYKGLCGTEDINASCQLDSAITKLANNNNGAGGNLTDIEKAAILSLPPQYRELVTDLQLQTVGATKLDPTTSNAGEIIKDDIRLLALSSVLDMVDEIFAEIKTQVEAYKGSGKDMLLKLIADSRDELWREAQKLQVDAQYGTLSNSSLKLMNRINRYNTVPTVSPSISTIGKTLKEH